MSNTVTLDVAGMSCAHCVQAVIGAIRAEDPGADVAVDLASGTVRATTRLAAQRLAELVREEGYTVAATR